jgi:hypothetical protein
MELCGIKTKLMLTNKTLWQNIQNFMLDDATAKFPFSKKLAKEQKWTVEFTNKAIEEYKKFMYLCCVSQSGASPSKIIDEVWHLHLTYTVNYWEKFCSTILQKNMHHHPSNGNETDKLKYKKWEINTLELYQNEFEQKPPNEIWLPNVPSKRFLPFSLIFISGFIITFFSSCNSHDKIGMSVGGFVFVAILIGYKALIKTQAGKNNNRDGGGCKNGAGCSSGCTTGCGGGGGCGGGCGGCGS